MNNRFNIFAMVFSVALAAFSCGGGSPSEMTFTEIPAGFFLMGSSADEQGRFSDEDPRHRVDIDAFEMMTTEVTQTMWEEVMGENPASGPGEGGDHPVFNVSWYDCVQFVEKLNEKEDGYVYRLPSEAEWEYACRAGTETRYYWGDDPGQTMIDDHAWHRGNSEERARPVAQKDPNPWGLYDMTGNVWEWCRDSWHDDYTGAPGDGSAWEEDGAEERISRGGSWLADPDQCRSAYRFLNSADFSYAAQGLRVVRTREE